MKNKISVILPVYNGEKSIAKAIQSLIDQSFKFLKIIVIDDGSIDTTSEIVETFQDIYPDRIEYYYKKNTGIASSRNFGLSKVDTEYFGFLDADDYVEKNMYQMLYEEIIKKDSDLCSCDFYWTYPDTKQLKLAVDGPFENKKQALEKLFMTLWNKLYKTEFIKRLDVSFPNGLHYEDAYFLYCLIPYLDNMAYVSEAMVYYVQANGSITHTYTINIQDMMEVFKGIRVYYQNHGFEKIYNSELEYIFIRFFLGNSYLRTCNIKDKKVRNQTLKLAWDFLNDNYPSWQKNIYLNNSGLKNQYFKYMNKTMYFFNVYIFKFLYKLNIMK